MKLSASLLVILFSLISSVHGAEDSLVQLAASAEKWTAASKEAGGNYSYQVTTSSMMGFRTATTITVEEGKVVERKYEESAPPAPVAPGAPIQQANGGNGYTEKGDEIGKNKKGAKAHTMEELYAAAKKILEKPQAPSEKLYLRFDDAGLLKSCFTVDTRIMDDAPIKGVTITNLKLK